MLVYLDGEFLPAQEARISVFDGGFLYGDGVYTTLRLYGGRAVDLQAHWERLGRHARALDLPVTLSLARLQDVAAHLAAANGLARADGRLRVTVSRGGAPPPPPFSVPTLPVPIEPGPTGSVPAVPDPTVLVTLVPIPPEIAAWQDQGIGVTVLGPAYARAHFPEVKSLNGLPSVLAQRRASRLGCPEALLTGQDGRLLEGSVSNVFLVGGDGISTPAPAGDFLPGLTRQHILEIAGAAGIPIREGDLDLADLNAAREVFVASSVREVLPVVRIDGRAVAAGRPGPVTRIIQDGYRRMIRARLSDRTGPDTA